jgi:CBS domain containing-hemolysin-like protein
MNEGVLAFLALVAALGLLFFALVEMAFTLLMRLPQRLEAERESDSVALGPYLDDPLQFFVPARLIRGLLLIVAIVLLAQIIDRGLVGAIILAASGVGIALGLGQILPAFIVRLSPERILELLLPPFTAVANAISPVTALIISVLGSARAPAARNGSAAPPAETAAPNIPGEEPQHVESRLLRSVVDFGDTLVREVMTPRPDIVAIRSDATIDELRQLLQEQEYSRLPVFTDNLDNVVGLIVVKDLIQRPEALAGTRSVAEIMRPAAFVPETKRVIDLLREFQLGRFQLAIVVDEYGGTAGLVTVEDVVEELVGEIRDEYDSEAEPIVRENDDTFVFSAKVGIEEMTDRLGVQIEDGDFETVGGYVLTRVGRVPDVGERFAFDGLGVEILEAEGRRIHKVRVTRAAAAEEVVG